MPNERVFWKGLVAGLAAGVAATAAKSIAEKIYPPHHDQGADPAETVAEKIAGHPLDESTSELAAEAIHWGFGAAAGAFYGVLAEYYPAATAKEGASFGIALMSLTHNKALPALGLEEKLEEQSLRDRTSEGATYLLFGFVAEKVRGWTREALD